MQVLQHEIRKTHAKSQQLEWIEELALTEIVGKGGFGVVYKGTWKGSVAAVKVSCADHGLKNLSIQLSSTQQLLIAQTLLDLGAQSISLV
jgi:predicted Ser/Thr protein kinase